MEDEKNGFVIEPRNETELTQKLLTLLQNPELAKKMGDHGRELIEKNLSWDIITNQVIDLYHELLGTA